MIFLGDQTIENFDKVEKSKIDARSHIDVVPKSYIRKFVNKGDIQVDVENVTNEHESYHDELVEDIPPEEPVEPELRRSTIKRQVCRRYPPHEQAMTSDNGDPKYYKRQFQLILANC